MEDLILIYKEVSAILPTWLQPLIIGLIGIYAKNTVFRNYVNKSVSKLFKTVARREILAHELFYHEKLFNAYAKRVMFKGNRIKTLIFSIMLTNIIYASIHIPRNMLKGKIKELRKMRSAEVIAFLLEMLENIRETYESEIKKDFNRNFGIYGKDIYELVYCSENGYKNFHESKMGSIAEDIDAMGHISNKYNETVRIFLYQMMFGIQKAVFDSIKVFNYFNGKLESIISKINQQGQI